MYEKANELFLKETGKKVNFVFSNYGGIRAEIGKGDVKVIHAFNLMPFDNTIVVAELTKEKTVVSIPKFKMTSLFRLPPSLTSSHQLTFKNHPDDSVSSPSPASLAAAPAVADRRSISRRVMPSSGGPKRRSRS